MSCLMNQYKDINKKIKGWQDRIRQLEEKILAINTQQDATIPNRIQNLKEQLDKIEEYTLKIEAFKQLAEKNLESKNVLTIEAPADYRINLNRLRNWAMMIDPLSTNDPYAQRVNVVAQCDLLFLERKKEEFSNRLQELYRDLEEGNTQELKQLDCEIQDLKTQLNEYAFSEELASFLDHVQSENNRYIFEESPKAYIGKKAEEEVLGIGAVGYPLEFDGFQKEHIKKMAGKFFDEENGRVYLPLEEIRYDKEFGMVVSCIPSRKRLSEMDAGIRNMLLHVVNETEAGSRKVYIIDAERQNSAVAGSLKALEGTFAVAEIPRSPEQITAVLEELVSSFADIDEQLGNCDSVIEYNESAEISRQIERKVVVFVGWPEAFHGKDVEFVNRIITNYERYGISFILASVKNNRKEDENLGLSEYLNENVVHINMSKSDTTLVGQDNHRVKFAWFTYRHDLAEEYIQAVKVQKIEQHKLGNEYTDRYDLSEGPQYTRGRKDLKLPIGIDSKDHVLSISFDNENFAAYLMGASGSGKSTLIHTLITGILMNYHPDDVELWLADFKMSEFAQYIDPLPPHVKYVLLDESQELVYDLIDKLTDKMMERQKFFMMHKELKKVENVPKEIYMPVIFVLFDEFSIMSQAVAESETYKLKLQNLLAKGRALGIKFLFSSQTFTKGVAGLTATAKDQIQSRVAMKNSKDEISETLQLSTSLKTEQVRNWLDALPPHYALYKYRNGDQLELKRMHVMYFKGEANDAYAEQKKLIHTIHARMKAVEPEAYDANSLDSYLKKHPVIVDGNSYSTFDRNEFQQKVSLMIEDKTNSYLGDELFVSFGSPRLMERQKLIPVFPESRQNFLLLGSSAENACMASVMTTIMRSFQSQGADVRIWAYERNKIFTKYREVWNEHDIFCDLGAICDEIYSMKEALQKTDHQKETLIVLLGFENLCADFELAEKNRKTRPAEPKTKFVEEDSETQKIREQDRSLLDEIASDIMREEAADEEESMEDDGTDLTTLLQETEALFADLEQDNAAGSENSLSADSGSISGVLYNANEDLQYIATRGSRKGIHLLLGVNSYADLKQTGLKLDWFTHRLAFQIPADDSRMVFGSKIANTLPEHVCEYTDSLESFSFRPYIHRGISWDGWEVDEDDTLQNIFTKKKEE